MCVIYMAYIIIHLLPTFFFSSGPLQYLSTPCTPTNDTVCGGCSANCTFCHNLAGQCTSCDNSTALMPLPGTPVSTVTYSCVKNCSVYPGYSVVGSAGNFVCTGDPNMYSLTFSMQLNMTIALPEYTQFMFAMVNFLPNPANKTTPLTLSRMTLVNATTLLSNKYLVSLSVVYPVSPVGLDITIQTSLNISGFLATLRNTFPTVWLGASVRVLNNCELMPCSVGEYCTPLGWPAPVTPATGRVCSLCQACAVGMYRSAGCDGVKNTTCINWTTCSLATQYEVCYSLRFSPYIL